MRRLAHTLPVLSLVVVLGWALSLATTRVRNWFVMTDELYYERLAISVAQTGSLLPRVHGELVANVNQLYPVVLAAVFGDGSVGSSLEAAHRLNAFLIVSAAIPVYLLARTVGVGFLLALWSGVLAAVVPWVVLASFLLTEVVAYPAFCWALLAIVHAVSRRTAQADLLALAAIALAVLARVQLVVLLAVLLVAVAVEGRAALRRRVLVAVAAAGLLLVAVTALVSDSSKLLGSYAVTATTLHVDFGLAPLVAEHVGVLALGLGFLPFLLGAAWLVDRARADGPEGAFAVVGLAALTLVTLQVASFDQRFGAEEVKDRYLFYVVPVVVVALAAAVAGGVRPRWWAFLVPAVPAALGFLTVPLTTYEKLNVDSPLAMLNDGILELATTVDWARAMLVLAVVVALLLLLVLPAFVRPRAVAVAAAVAATAVLPLETAYAFERLFRVNGTNGLPVTLDQSGVFGWVDRHLGGDARVTWLRYPVESPDWWAGQGYWWDLEFWNESAVRPWGEVDGWEAAFDAETGASLRPGETQYVVVHGSDVRFRLAGRQVAFERGAWIFEPERPWRAAWLTRGIYPDGWTRPHTPAEIVVYAEPGQTEPLWRFLTLSLASPAKDRDRPFAVESNLHREEGTLVPEVAVDVVARVCVPPNGSARVLVSTSHVSAVYRDPTKGALTGEQDRPAGILLRSIALADERVAVERCPAEPRAEAPPTSGSAVTSTWRSGSAVPADTCSGAVRARRPIAHVRPCEVG